MANTSVIKMKRRAPAPSIASLGPGIHPARIDVCAGERFHLRTLAGQRVEARLADDVELAFAQECLREHRTVLVTSGDDGVAVILGALQTARGVSRDDTGTVRSRGKRVEIEAEDGLVLRVGQSALVMDKRGTMKLVGQKMTVNVSDVVQVLSALCKLP